MSKILKQESLCVCVYNCIAQFSEAKNRYSPI